jgi:hypothetical protein
MADETRQLAEPAINYPNPVDDFRHTSLLLRPKNHLLCVARDPDNPSHMVPRSLHARELVVHFRHYKSKSSITARALGLGNAESLSLVMSILKLAASASNRLSIGQSKRMNERKKLQQSFDAALWYETKRQMKLPRHQQKNL